MMTIEEMEILLGEIAEDIPEELYQDLNGGILLLPEAKLHPKTTKANDLFTLGEYHRNAQLGRFVALYYGSFMRVYGWMDKEQLREKITSTLKHELTHHWESLAGERGLEIEDAERIEKYLKNWEQRG